VSLLRRNPRRDKNEGAIAAALEAVGASVVRVSAAGCPDLLVGFQGRNWLLEVKTATGELTIAQTAFRTVWRGQYALVRDADEALAVLGVGGRRFQAGDRPWLQP
jgi:hypothetical protein